MVGVSEGYTTWIKIPALDLADCQNDYLNDPRRDILICIWIIIIPQNVPGLEGDIYCVCLIKRNTTE